MVRALINLNPEFMEQKQKLPGWSSKAWFQIQSETQDFAEPGRGETASQTLHMMMSMIIIILAQQFSFPNKDQVWITAGSRLGLFVSFTRQIGHLFLEEDFHSLRAQEVQILACPHGISKALFLDVGFQQRGNPWQSFSNPRPSFVSPISSKQIAHSGRLLRFLFLSSSSSVCNSFFSSSSS